MFLWRGLSAANIVKAMAALGSADKMQSDQETGTRKATFVTPTRTSHRGES